MFAVKHVTDRQGNVLVQDPPIAQFLFSNSKAALIWLFVRLYIGYEWLEAGWHKFTDPAWMETGQGILGYWTRALGNAPNGKPIITYDWYRTFIQFLVDSGSHPWFAKLIVLGELAVGLGLIVGALVGGLTGGLGIEATLKAFNSGLGGGATVALSYALLGAFAVAIAKSGMAHALADKALAMVDRQHFVRQGMSHAGLGNGHRESTEQRVGQCHGRPAAEAAVEGFEGRFDTQATGQATDQCTDDQGDHHMHAGQAEDQHDADRGNYCIHFITSIQTKRLRPAVCEEPPAD